MDSPFEGQVRNFLKSFWEQCRPLLAFLVWIALFLNAIEVSATSSGAPTWLAWLVFFLFATWRLRVGKLRYDARQRENALKYYMSSKGLKNPKKFVIQSYGTGLLKFWFLLLYLASSNALAFSLLQTNYGFLAFLATIAVPFSILLCIEIFRRRRREALDTEQSGGGSA